MDFERFPEKRQRAPSVDDARTLQKHESAAQRLAAEGSVTKDLPSTSRETRPWSERPRVSRSGSGSGGDEAGRSEGEGDAEGDDEEPTFPEGGWQAWSVVLGSWLALFSSLGIMNSLATFHTYIGTNQLAGYNEGAVGWVFSVYTFLVFGCGIYIGPIFDKYGARWLVLGGTVCLVVSLMLLSISTQYWHFMLTFGILNGFGASLLFTPSIAAVGHWFRARRGLATGVASTGGSLGGIAFPLALHALFDRVGFAWAVRIVAFICLVFCGAANLLIRTRLPPARDATPHPDLRILRDPAFALTTLGVFLLEFSLFIPLTYISSYMVREGFNVDFSYQILAILNAGSVMGRVLAGWWGDYFGAFNSNILAVLLSVFMCLAVWLPFGGTTAGIVVFVLGWGFASGNNISISPVCIGRLCRTENYGRYYATTYTMVSFACLIGIPIGGEVLSANGGDYKGLIIMTGVIYVGSAAALWGAKVVCVGWKLLAIF
ncbi:riboflavin transporter MCH5 [Plectosphaerella plurivora]|uniref:Riboflavin transporter MCH5 n=1 Tax=Plectosphaerella plurivora TaxID=936078 RepID=A0A9P8V074_9PEZI|nr:riboflavin transporter MCH5 [Plectosphaerella plurivora]